MRTADDLTRYTDRDPERLAQMTALALEVLESVRSSLAVSFRFLDRALFKMPFEQIEGLGYLGTDGKRVYFDPLELLARYMQDPGETTRDFLHMVVHCIFYHPFVGPQANAFAWGLSCDVVAEAACMELAGERFSSPDDGTRLKVVRGLERELGNLSAEKLYRYFMTGDFEDGQAEALVSLFERDDHGAWFADELPDDDAPDRDADSGTEDGEQGGSVGSAGEKQGAEPGADDTADDAAEGGADARRRDEEGADADDSSGSDAEQDGGAHAPQQDLDALMSPDSDRSADAEAVRAEWEGVSKQVKVDLETRSRDAGAGGGRLLRELARVNRRRSDYREFLRRFAELQEELVIDDSDFDPIFYTFGLQRYGNMPLIEPLEFREAEKVREFVIAIDTSGSVEGALVKRFVEETYTLLGSSAGFAEKVNVHIVQCDARIQRDDLITSQAELEKLMRSFQLRGFGGTDFRPVFDYVIDLVDRGRFENLKGLVYFTDGYGTYPETCPPFETAFVFVDDSGYTPDVPAWAFKVVLDPLDIGADVAIEHDRPSQSRFFDGHPGRLGGRRGIADKELT